MKPPVFYALSSLILVTVLTSPIHAAPPSVTTAIDQFVAKVFPKASHYFWVVNDTQTESQHEMIVDINTFVTNKDGEDIPIENRFLLLVLNGEVLAAQKIPLNAHVDCGKDTEI